MTALAYLVPVEDVRPGDVLRRPSGRTHVVVTIAAFDDGAYVVVYAAFEEASYENKARDRSGFSERTRTRDGEQVAILRSWRPLRAGELVPLSRRGDGGALEEALEALGTVEAEEQLVEHLGAREPSA